MSPTAGPDGLPPLREVIERHGLNAKKSLGQNFLLDLNLTRKIARLSGNLGDRTIVEIGPGPGGLTRALLMEGAKHVIAIERDARCLPALEEIAARYPGRLTVHSGDALEADWPALIAGSRPVTIAANLPYGIASQLLVRLARDGAVATMVRPDGADVSARSCRSHRGHPADEGLRPPLRPGAVANARQNRDDAAARSVHTGAESCVRRRRVYSHSDAGAAMPGRDARPRYGSGLRPTQKDAAFEPQAIDRCAGASAARSGNSARATG